MKEVPVSVNYAGNQDDPQMSLTWHLKTDGLESHTSTEILSENETHPATSTLLANNPTISGHNTSQDKTTVRLRIRETIIQEMASFDPLILPGTPDDTRPYQVRKTPISNYSSELTKKTIHDIVSEEISSFLDVVHRKSPSEQDDRFEGEKREILTSRPAEKRARASTENRVAAWAEVDVKDSKNEQGNHEETVARRFPLPSSLNITTEPVVKDDGKRLSMTSQTSVLPIQKKFQMTVELSCPWLFGGFTQRSPVRIKCFQIFHSVEWSTFFGVVSIACAMYIALAPDLALGYMYQRAEANGNKNHFRATDAFELFCAACLMFEVLVGSIAVGFVSEQTCWLRCSNYHKLDFFVLLTTGVEYIGYLYGYRSASLRAARLLRIFRPLSALDFFLDVRLILISLREGLFQVLTVMLIMFLFITSLAVFGLAMYKTTYRRQCVWVTKLVPNCASDMTNGWNATCDFATDIDNVTVTPSLDVNVAGGYPFTDYCKIYRNSTPRQYAKTYPYDADRGYYHSCQLRDFRAGFPVAQTCIDFGPGANVFQWGYTHFDNIWGSMMAIFQASSRRPHFHCSVCLIILGYPNVSLASYRCSFFAGFNARRLL